MSFWLGAAAARSMSTLLPTSPDGGSEGRKAGEGDGRRARAGATREQSGRGEEERGR